MFYPYPNDVPTADVIQLVQDAILKKAVDRKAAAHAVWHVAGYGLGQWDHQSPVLMASPPACDPDTCVADLESLKPGGPMRGAFPWGSLLPVLLQLLAALLQKPQP